MGGGESWWLHVNILYSKVALFPNEGKHYILQINQPTQSLWSPRNTRDVDLAFALKQVRSKKEPEEELPKGVGMGVRGWVLNILVRWFFFVCLFVCFWLCCKACGTLVAQQGWNPHPLLEAWSPNHQTDREVPCELFKINKSKSMF